MPRSHDRVPAPASACTYRAPRQAPLGSDGRRRAGAAPSHCAGWRRASAAEPPPPDPGCRPAPAPRISGHRGRRTSHGVSRGQEHTTFRVRLNVDEPGAVSLVHRGMDFKRRVKSRIQDECRRKADTSRRASMTGSFVRRLPAELIESLRSREEPPAGRFVVGGRGEPSGDGLGAGRQDPPHACRTDRPAAVPGRRMPYYGHALLQHHRPGGPGGSLPRSFPGRLTPAQPATAHGRSHPISTTSRSHWRSRAGSSSTRSPTGLATGSGPASATSWTATATAGCAS